MCSSRKYPYSPPHWNFQRGGEMLEKIPSVGEVWIFSGTTHCAFLFGFCFFVCIVLFCLCFVFLFAFCFLFAFHILFKLFFFCLHQAFLFVLHFFVCIVLFCLHFLFLFGDVFCFVCLFCFCLAMCSFLFTILFFWDDELFLLAFSFFVCVGPFWPPYTCVCC